jgi:hypothetical protein
MTTAFTTRLGACVVGINGNAMPLPILRLVALAGFLLSQSAIAQTYPCEERSQWLGPATVTQRDLVHLQVAKNTRRRFAELVTQPNLTPDNELWAYKILTVGPYILSLSPYASAEVKPLFVTVSEVTAGIIRGQVDFPTFQSKLKLNGTVIDQLIAKVEPAERSFMTAHKEDLERLSNCVLITAMYNAGSKKGGK